MPVCETMPSTVEPTAITTPRVGSCDLLTTGTSSDFNTLLIFPSITPTREKERERVRESKREKEKGKEI